MDNNKDQQQTPEAANNAEIKKQTQDYPNMPAAAKKQTPPDIQKEDIEKASDLNHSGKTDNTEENGN